MCWGGGGEGDERAGWMGGGNYPQRYTVTTRIALTHASRRGSAESDFNVSLIVRGKVTIKTVSSDHNFEKGSEPKRENVTECRISLPISGGAGSVYQYPVVPATA